MAEASHLDWPFFDEPHRALAREAAAWAAGEAGAQEPTGEGLDAACRALVARLGADGWLRHCVPASHGGASERLDARSLCLVREALAYRSGLADFVFAMQGLGSAPISLFGSPALKATYLPAVAAGARVCAFALSEPEAGSDVAALTTAARRDGDAYRLDGVKTWISNAGLADQYIVFARTGEAPGTKGLSAFVVDADAAGLAVSERIELMAAHPIGTLALTDCRVPASHVIGAPGEGFKIAMATLDIFRPSVAAAAIGFARHALDIAVTHARQRQAFGRPIAAFQAIQHKLADMALAIDAGALLTYRAAWAMDLGTGRVSREAAMAKLHATEEAQKVIDQAVQILGALGVVRGSPVERLYREIRALRIYEGTSEIQKQVIARAVLEPEAATTPADREEGPQAAQ